MNFTDEQAALILNEIRTALNGEGTNNYKARRIWQQMISGHAQVLAMALPHLVGTRVLSGPFQGMQLTEAALQGVSAPTLLGCYEHELHPTIRSLITQPFRHIVNIGCAYGYYSVGLARAMPSVSVHAFDIDENARRNCQEMAAVNGVQDRVTINREFRGEDFARYADEETLIVMDVEGAEMSLLDPALFPALRKMTILVELHDVYNAAISTTIRDRFAGSHDVEIIPNKLALAAFDLQQAVPGTFIDPFDQFLCSWENRGGATPWGVMRPKS